MAGGEIDSKLAQALRSGRFVVVADCPTDADAVKRLSATLPSLDGVVACDGALSGVALSSLLVAEGLEPVLGLSTAQRNRTALLADARGAALLGVKSVFCFTGDHPSLASTPEAAGAFDIDPVQLLQLLQDGGGPGLLLGAEVYPQVRPLELALIDTRKKVAAGAALLVTQPVLDLAAFDEWLTAARAEGLVDKAPVVASVRLEGDDAIDVCAETAARLKGLEGVRGLYIRSSDGPESVAEVMRRAGLSA